jgi:hypothetical protein
MMPAMTFIKVDLPAPFPPIGACTVPGRTLMLTPSSANHPGVAFGDGLGLQVIGRDAGEVPRRQAWLRL